MRELIVERIAEMGLPGWLIPDYWMMLTAAIIVASLLALRLARSADVKAPVADLLFWGILALFIGSKVVYGLQYGLPGDLSEWFLPAGFALYGGLLGLLAAWGFYYLLRPFPLLEFLDSVTPALGLGLFLGRIGCFLAGCNGGLPCNLPWCVRFPPGTSSYRHQVSNGLIDPDASLSLTSHPTQLYESLFGLASFLLLLYLWKNRHRPGEVFLTGVIWYSLFRFVSEWLRADGGGMRPFGLTFAQFASLIILAGGLTLAVLRFSAGSRGEEGRQ